MYRILEKIKIKTEAQVTEKVFRNEEINPSVRTSFKCCNCEEENPIEIIPYQTGYPFLGIYNGESVLTVNELLENRIISKTSSWASYLGEYTVNDLPTLYFGISCKYCGDSHLVVFSYGEKQPGLTICEISGVWEFAFLDTKNT